MIYLDSAATTFQKPPAVGRAMTEALASMSSPGRGGHPLAMRAADTAFQCRTELAELFDLDGPEGVAFTLNATHALNIPAPLHIGPQGAKSLPPQERQSRSQIVGRDPHHIGTAQIRQVTGRPKELAADPCTVQRSLHPLRIRHGAGKDQIIFHACSSFSSLFLRREHTGLTSGMAA